MEIEDAKNIIEWSSKIGCYSECGTWMLFDVDWIITTKRIMYLTMSSKMERVPLDEDEEILKSGKINFQIDQGCVEVAEISFSRENCYLNSADSWSLVKQKLDEAFIEYDEKSIFL